MCLRIEESDYGKQNKNMFCFPAINHLEGSFNLRIFDW